MKKITIWTAAALLFVACGCETDSANTGGGAALDRTTKRDFDRMSMQLERIAKERDELRAQVQQLQQQNDELRGRTGGTPAPRTPTTR